MSDIKFFYILIPAALVAFLVSFFLNPRLIRLAQSRKWYDMPSARRVHKTPLPRIGGVAMFAGFTTAIGATLLVNLFDSGFWQPDDMWRIILTLLGATFITGVMLYDDLFYLSPLPKFLAQIIAGLIVIFPHFLNSSPAATLISEIRNPFNGTNITFGPIFSVLFTLFWIAGMMNAVNGIDGLDGLAGGVVGISALVLFFENLYSQRDNPLQFTSSLLALTLAASIVGFLPFNWHPSKIIMGDCGAMFLGYALAVISIIDGAKLAAALLVIGFPVLDYAWVLFLRISHRRRPTGADRSHIHHRLLELGYSQRQIVLFFYAITLAFGIVGLLIPQDSRSKLLALLVLGFLLVPILVYSMRGYRKQEFNADEKAERRSAKKD